jgi:SAM-dependent methyltransferase
MTTTDSDRAIQQAVSDRYAGIAERQLATQTAQPGGLQFEMAATAAEAACCDDECCGDASVSATPEEIRHAVKLYTDGDALAAVPEGAVNASLGCGNPVAIAELRAGERVLDLGSGGGIDCFIASKQVGPDGEVWGLDMTPQMIRLARRNAKQVDATNVQFRLGEIEDMPFEEGYFDAIISNCVINLSTDKARVFQEAFRVLKPGGRLRVSDIVWTRDVPVAERGDSEAWAGCIAGALPLAEYLGHIESAGFLDASADYEENERGIASAYVSAVKPA